MQKNRERKTECVYSSGFTVVKEWRKNRELAKIFRELTAAVTYHDSIYRNVGSFIGAAVLRFKVQTR
jgi:hypothetical protein